MSIDKDNNRVFSEVEGSKVFEVHGALPATFLDKLLVFYWLYPKSWSLTYFKLDGDTFTLSTGNGKTHTITNGSFKAKIDIDRNHRRKITIETDANEKIPFFETMTDINDADFDKIVELLGAEESKLMKFTKAGESLLQAANRVNSSVDFGNVR